MTSFQYTEIKYMLTVRETANILGVSVHTVYRLIESGGIVSYESKSKKNSYKS